jgi:phosphoglycolate phosphatase-like HAD superfamily hydrolase
VDPANKKLIIFDFDGVFNLDSMEAYYHVYNSTLQELGLSLPLEEQRQIIDSNWGSSHKKIVEALLQGEGGSRHLDDAVDTYKEILADDFSEIIKPVPGAVQMLGRLASRYSLALNTAADPEVLFEKVMPKLDMHPLMFEGHILTAMDLEDPRLAKPDPYTAVKLMEINNVAPHETVMVGDSSVDVLTAMHAGIEDIVVPLTGSLTREQAQEYGVEIVPDVTYLEQLLGRTCAERCLKVNVYS